MAQKNGRMYANKRKNSKQLNEQQKKSIEK